MGLFDYKFIPDDVAQGFVTRYKYSSKDTSPLSNYVMHPFWDKIVLLVPKNVAPNCLTFGGFVFLMIQFGITSYYDYHFLRPLTIPNWVWIVSSICIFFAHHLDGIDGKQARRTGTSSPLGELFDHGIDSLTTALLPVGCYSLFGRCPVYGGDPTLLLFCITIVQFVFYCSHWEKYITGILYLPWGYDLGLSGVTLLFGVVFFMGGPGVLRFYIFGYSFCRLVLGGMVFTGIFSYLTTLKNIAIHVHNNDKNSKPLISFFEAMRPLFSPILFLAVVWITAFKSHFLLDAHPREFFLFVGFVFSNIVCKLIISQMAVSRSSAFEFILLPCFPLLFLQFADCLGLPRAYLAALGGAQGIYYYFLAYLIFAIVYQFYFAICVVRQIANTVNVWIFSVEKRPAIKKYQ